jgi:hypothetical protein
MKSVKETNKEKRSIFCSLLNDILTPVFSFPEFSRKHLPELSLPDDESFDITSVRDPGADPRESSKHLSIITTLTKQFFFTNHSFPVPYTFVEIYEASRTKKHFSSLGIHRFRSCFQVVHF